MATQKQKTRNDIYAISDEEVVELIKGVFGLEDMAGPLAGKDEVLQMAIPADVLGEDAVYPWELGVQNTASGQQIKLTACTLTGEYITTACSAQELPMTLHNIREEILNYEPRENAERVAVA